MKISFFKIGLAICLATVIAIVSIGCIGYKRIDKTVKLIQPIDKEEVKEMVNPNLPEEVVKTTLKDNWTVALFGIDTRDMSDLLSSNSDVIILASVNNKTGEIKLVSVYRDTCLKTGKSRYKKVNEAYGIGGPKKAVEVLNENLDLQIDDYIAVNWAAVATAINILGGVDIEITEKEFRYINSYITETVNSTGIGSYQLKEPGLNHLDGIQAVAYCRLRYTDNDFKRTERQRLVLSLLLDKAKNADWATINNVIVTVFPMASSSIDTNDLIYLGKNILKYKLSDTTGFPFTHIEKRVEGLDYVFPDTLQTNVSELHKFLYGEQAYEPSNAVKEISKKITEKKSSNSARKPEPETVASTESTQEETTAEEIKESISEETNMYDIPPEERNNNNYGPGFVPIESSQKEETVTEETEPESSEMMEEE